MFVDLMFFGMNLMKITLTTNIVKERCLVLRYLGQVIDVKEQDGQDLYHIQCYERMRDPT